MKKILSVINILCIATIKVFAVSDNTPTEVAKIKLPAPKILAEKYFDIYAKAKGNPQELFKQTMILSLIGYPDFQNVSPTDAINIAVFESNNRYHSFVEISATKKSRLFVNLKKALKFKNQNGRLLAQFSGEKNIDLPASFKFDKSPTNALLEASVKNPLLLAEIFPLPQILLEHLKKSSSANIKVFEQPQNIGIKVDILPKQENISTLKQGIDLQQSLPNGNFTIASNLLGKRPTQIKIETSNGEATLITNGNFALSVKLQGINEVSEIYAICVGEIIGKNCKFNENTPYAVSIKSVPSNIVDTMPTKNMWLMVCQNYVIISTQENALTKIADTLRSINFTTVKQPSLVITQLQNNQKTSAEILFSKGAIHINISLPFNMVKNLIEILFSKYLQTQ